MNVVRNTILTVQASFGSEVKSTYREPDLGSGANSMHGEAWLEE